MLKFVVTSGPGAHSYEPKIQCKFTYHSFFSIKVVSQNLHQSIRMLNERNVNLSRKIALFALLSLKIFFRSLLPTYCDQSNSHNVTRSFIHHIFFNHWSILKMFYGCNHRTWIARKADCTQERHLFISTKHPQSPPL